MKTVKLMSLVFIILQMKLLKLAYISHGWMLGVYNKPLLKEKAEAWQYGPVIPSLYQRYKQFGGGQITDVPKAEPKGLSPEEKDVIGQVWNIYGKYNGLQLSALTHQVGTPWDITRKAACANAVISDELIQDHYQSLAAKA
jgi:uncharacterized phage-associated protein